MINNNKRGQLCSLLFLTLLSVFNSCTDEYVGISVEKDQIYNLEQPLGFPEITYDLAGNPLTVNGIALGKKLFYEGKLSRNNTISCGFCHIQENAFTHHGHPVSHGIDDRLGIRNAPAIQNVKLQLRFRESHPELAFHFLNDRVSMQFNKKTKEGQEERLKLLSQFSQNVEKVYDNSIKKFMRKDVAKDDVIDALCLAVTLRQILKNNISLEMADFDEKNLGMKIHIFQT